MNVSEIADSMRALSNERRAAQKWFEEQIDAEADAEVAYRKKRSKAWLEVEGTAKQREDAVDALTADDRYQRDLARGLRQAALEKIRGVRQEMSMFQTYMAVQRAETELHRFDEGAA